MSGTNPSEQAKSKEDEQVLRKTLTPADTQPAVTVENMIIPGIAKNNQNLRLDRSGRGSRGAPSHLTISVIRVSGNNGTPKSANVLSSKAVTSTFKKRADSTRKEEENAEVTFANSDTKFGTESFRSGCQRRTTCSSLSDISHKKANLMNPVLLCAILRVKERTKLRLLTNVMKNIDRYNAKTIENIMYGSSTHLVCAFKEHLINDDTNEFLNRFYTKSEIPHRLQGFYEYHHKVYGARPNYAILQERFILLRNEILKRRLIKNGGKLSSETKQNPRDIRLNLFTSAFMRELDKDDLEVSRFKGSQMQSYMKCTSSTKRERDLNAEPATTHPTKEVTTFSPFCNESMPIIIEPSPKADPEPRIIEPIPDSVKINIEPVAIVSPPKMLKYSAPINPVLAVAEIAELAIPIKKCRIVSTNSPKRIVNFKLVKDTAAGTIKPTTLFPPLTTAANSVRTNEAAAENNVPSTRSGPLIIIREPVPDTRSQKSETLSPLASRLLKIHKKPDDVLTKHQKKEKRRCNSSDDIEMLSEKYGGGGIADDASPYGFGKKINWKKLIVVKESTVKPVLPIAPQYPPFNNGLHVLSLAPVRSSQEVAPPRRIESAEYQSLAVTLLPKTIPRRKREHYPQYADKGSARVSSLERGSGNEFSGRKERARPESAMRRESKR